MKKLLSAGIASLLISSSATVAYGQAAVSANPAPIQVAQADSGGASTSGGATSGGAASGGATSSAPAAAATPATPAEQAALQPGNEAGTSGAAVLSDTALLGIAAAALVAGIIVAVTNNGGHSSGTTTTTTGTR